MSNEENTYCIDVVYAAYSSIIITGSGWIKTAV